MNAFFLRFVLLFTKLKMLIGLFHIYLESSCLKRKRKKRQDPKAFHQSATFPVFLEPTRCCYVEHFITKATCLNWRAALLTMINRDL